MRVVWAGTVALTGTEGPGHGSRRVDVLKEMYVQAADIGCIYACGKSGSLYVPA